MTLREAVGYCPKGRIWDSMRAALLIGSGRGHARVAAPKSLGAFGEGQSCGSVLEAQGMNSAYCTRS